MAHLLIEKDGSVTVAADSSDCPRMEAEQNALGAKGMLIPWYESFEAHLKDYIGDRTFASDTGIVGMFSMYFTGFSIAESSVASVKRGGGVVFPSRISTRNCFISIPWLIFGSV